MTGPYRTDAKGRSTSSRKSTRSTRIEGQFSYRTIAMMESPAFRVLSLGAHRLLARLEIEIAHHGGTSNGSLIVTFAQFESFGVERHAIGPALRELEALGFLRFTERGRSGNAAWRRPSIYRLTYRPSDNGAPTNDWERIKSDEQASEIGRAARREKQIPSAENPTTSRWGKPTTNAKSEVGKPHH